MTTATQEVKITAPPIGRGILLISRSLTQELFPELLKLDDYTLQGELRAQGVFDKVHERLLLPTSYRVVSIFFGSVLAYHASQWVIVVESEDIPLDTNVLTVPRIEPIYTQDADGTAHLVRIDISK